MSKRRLVYLPDDILVEILLRLPVKPLLKCSKVCKSWYRLILNPTFISKHLEKNISKTNDESKLLLVRHFDSVDKFSLCFDNGKFDMNAELYCPFQRVSKDTIIGTCNGLVCLAFDHAKTIIIWNPCARKSVNVPKVDGLCQGLTENFMLGFGFDSVNNDYKIVRVGYYYYRDSYNVMIYSLSTGVWKNKCSVAPDVYSYFRSPAFNNGHVHWTGTRWSQDGIFHNFLSAFDMSNEVFREVMVPETLSECLVLILSVLTWDKSLALVQNEKMERSEFCWIWKMKEYGVVESWVRLFKIDFSEVGWRARILRLQRTNEVILKDSMKRHVMYHPDTKQIQCLGMHGDSFFVDSFVESLVLAERRNRALDF